MRFQTSSSSQPLSELVARKICRNPMQTPCISVYFLCGFWLDGQAFPDCMFQIFLEHMPSEKIITEVFAASTVFSAAAGLFIFTLQGRVSATKHVSMTWWGLHPCLKLHLMGKVDEYLKLTLEFGDLSRIILGLSRLGLSRSGLSLLDCGSCYEHQLNVQTILNFIWHFAIKIFIHSGDSSAFAQGPPKLRVCATSWPQRFCPWWSFPRRVYRCSTKEKRLGVLMCASI